MSSGTAHTEEEKAWAIEKMDRFGMAVKAIKENNMLEEYHERFGKTLKASGMYAWFRYVKDPLFKEKQKHTPRAKARKEQQVFTKSEFLAYINGTIAGFESKEDLKAMVEKNKLLSHEIRIYKAVPVEINYSVTF